MTAHFCQDCAHWAAEHAHRDTRPHSDPDWIVAWCEVKRRLVTRGSWCIEWSDDPLPPVAGQQQEMRI